MVLCAILLKSRLPLAGFSKAGHIMVPLPGAFRKWMRMDMNSIYEILYALFNISMLIVYLEMYFGKITLPVVVVQEDT